MQAFNKQAGFNLIEVLVTLVVLSVGLLGTAAMQMVSKKSTFESMQRTAAAWSATDILERMRVNNTELDSYLGMAAVDGMPVPARNCDLELCDPLQIAEFDRWRVSNVLGGVAETGASGATGGLVESTLCINGPADGSSGFYEVAIAWRGNAILSNAQAHPCGAGLYGAGDEFRRLLIYTTYIDAG